jgi:hypothetical protein
MRQVVGLQDALRKLAERMAAFEGVGLSPISYQNNITPQWVWKVWVTLTLAILGAFAWGWHDGGWSGLFNVAIFAGLGLFVSGVFSNATGLPRDRTHYNIAFHALSNRAAEYRKVGDLARANVADRLCALMMAVSGIPYADLETVQT